MRRGRVSEPDFTKRSSPMIEARLIRCFLDETTTEVYVVTYVFPRMEISMLSMMIGMSRIKMHIRTLYNHLIRCLSL